MKSIASSHPEIYAFVREFFHASRQPDILINEKGQIGFWNWDKSAFIVEFSSVEDARLAIANPSAFYGHGEEDAMGLGLRND